MVGRGPSSPNGPNGPIRGSESAEITRPPALQIRAPEAPREARRLRCPPLKSGAPNFCRFRAAKRA
eukprot:13153748-Alexandrium_andersonii.AAC.1